MRIKCKKCGDTIEGDKRGHLISCSCGAVAIDSTEFYTRLLGDSSDIIELDNEPKITITERIDKINYYLNIAEAVAGRSTCLKRRYGSIIVKNDELIASGYNGAPRGIKSCLECGYCRRENAERGKDYSDCSAVHSEMNSIISASRQEMIGADLYLVGVNQISNKYVENPAPCSICKRLIINAGIKRVFVRLDKTNYKVFNTEDWNIEDLVGGY